jgi:hypothetical protein
MAISGTNQWGPYTGPADGDTQPVYAPTATPPATGSLAPPQSPSGTSDTNTGRTLSAIATYEATSLNILNVGTTVPSNAGTT